MLTSPRLRGARLALVLALLSLPAALPARAAADPVTRAFDASVAASGIPGVSAAIVTDGALSWHGEAGVADRRTGQAVTQDTLFNVASITKTFTAAITMRLAEEGLIDLDAPVARYAPNLFPAARVVTVRELLGHTSGLQDYLNDPPHHWFNRAFLRQPGRVARLSARQILNHDHAIKFAPGTQYAYSNTDYVVLAAIIARVTGMPEDQVLQQMITGPLGLGHTTIGTDPASLGPVATPYMSRARTAPRDMFRYAPHMSSAFFAGPVFGDRAVGSTASDIARFEDALYGGRLLQPSSLVQMLTPGPVPFYGLGTLILTSGEGHLLVGHDGVMPGYNAIVLRDQDLGFTLAVLSNGWLAPYDESQLASIFNAVYFAWEREHLGAAGTAIMPSVMLPDAAQGLPAT
jgi:D-alanyl-D-alanine carboxypeptidase